MIIKHKCNEACSFHFYIENQLLPNSDNGNARAFFIGFFEFSSHFFFASKQTAVVDSVEWWQ